MLDGYKRANDSLHPTHSAVERAMKGETPKRRRKPLKALVPAGVAAVAALALLLPGLPGPRGARGGRRLCRAAQALRPPA